MRVDLRPLELSVEPSTLKIVIGTSEELTITATPTAMITIISGDANIASVPRSAAAFMLMGGAGNSTKITVSGGDNVNMTMLTIEATAAGHATETATVRCRWYWIVLRIEVDTDSLSLMEGGDSTELSVSLNRIDAGRGSVTVMIEPEGSGLTVSPSSLTFSRSSLGRQSITVDTTTDSTYTGDRECNVDIHR